MKSNHFVNSKLGRSLNIGSTSFQRTDRNIYPAGPSAACPVAMVRIGAAGLRAGNDLALISASPRESTSKGSYDIPDSIRTAISTVRIVRNNRDRRRSAATYCTRCKPRSQNYELRPYPDTPASRPLPIPSCRHSFRASSDRCPNGASRRPAPNRYPTTEPDRAESSRPESACRRGADRPQYTAPWLRTESPTR